MEDPIIEQIAPKPKKTADKKAYIREYKRKEYQENREEMKGKGRAYYFKYRYNATAEDHSKYETYLPNVVKIRKELEILKAEKPEYIKEILAPYL
jgi:hypothetical protein